MNSIQKFENWHKKAPFGLFIHWGVYSIAAYHEQELMRTDVGRDAYETLYMQFNPVEYEPEQWVIMAKEAGMKYICFTAKHHDGFCMWDTATTDYNIMKTPYGKDVLKMLQNSCDKHGIYLSIYYSIPDWHNISAYNKKSSHQIPPRLTDKPDKKKYKEYLKKQIGELLTNYGKISTLFWDIPPKIKDKTINEYVRSLQPEILINDRGYDSGDFSTPERKIPKGGVFTTPTEACQSIGRQAWGYRSNEDYYSISTLKKGICRVQTMGGNYLLNVAPMANGAIPQQAKEIVAEVGKWYNKTSESFVCTEHIKIFSDKNIVAKVKDNILYVIMLEGLNTTGIVLSPIIVEPESVVLLNDSSVSQFSLDRIPTYYKRSDKETRYLHIYDIDNGVLNGEPVVFKLVFPKGTDMTRLVNGKGGKSEARF